MDKRSVRWMIASYALLFVAIASMIVTIGLVPRTPAFPSVLAGAVVVVLLLGLAWMWTFYRYSYRRMRSISELVSEKFGGSRLNDHPDTVGYIRSAIEELADQVTALNQLTRKNHNNVKRQIFLNIIEGSFESAEQLHRQLDWPRLSVPGPDYIFVIVEIDIPLSCPESLARERFLHKQTLRSAVQNKTLNEQMLIWSDWIDPRRLGVIHNVKAGGQDESAICAIYEGLRRWTEQNLPFTITVGISGIRPSVEQIALSYKSVASALHYKPSLGTNRIIRSDEAPPPRQADLSRHLQKIRHMCVMLRMGDPKWSECLLQLRSALAAELLGLPDLVLLFRYMMDHLQTELAQMPAELRKIWINEKERFEQVLADADTRDALLDGFHDGLDKVFAELRRERESRHSRQLLDSIAAYIEEHCTKSEFALMDVSAAFGLSHSHLSRMISEGLGVKFIDYVTKVRMEKAKQLLLSSAQLNIGDVGERVGYSHAVTFIRTFKKYTGCTPGNFRKGMT